MHHIIDPATGMPVLETWATVSVAAASCTDANIASTAALVRGRRPPRHGSPGWDCRRVSSTPTEASRSSATGRRPAAAEPGRRPRRSARPTAWGARTAGRRRPHEQPPGGLRAEPLLVPDPLDRRGRTAAADGRDRARRSSTWSAGARRAGPASWSTRCIATSRSWRWCSSCSTSSPRCSTASPRSRSSTRSSPSPARTGASGSGSAPPPSICCWP